VKCNKRFTTYEKILMDLMVVKKDGRKEPFDIDKIKKGISLSFEKRPFTEKEIENVSLLVEKELRRLKNHEINSRIIGNKIIKRLKSLDQVAYLRFASVYKDFDKVDDFKEELKILVN
tara:strand:- start:55464 stop:55817 length:354 start_codon:yes stop_codon:yes gene_type:complete